jgi:CheY-like chemotaxis protein
MKKILIVDDEPDVSPVLKKVLEQIDHQALSQFFTIIDKGDGFL